MKYTFINNNLVGNIVDETQLASCPTDHTAVELNDGEKCGIFWLYSATGNPRFIQPLNHDEGLQNLTVSVVNNVPQWNLTYKSEAEIISHFDKLEKAALETVKEKLLAIEKERLYSENLTVINNLTDTLALEKADQYPPFKIGKAYLQNERFYYPINQKLYKVLQSHTSQAQWLPTEAVSLYVAVTPENVIAAWVQPVGSQDAYQIGDKVTYGGFTWESTAANNVWQPGVYGWVKI